MSLLPAPPARRVGVPLTSLIDLVFTLLLFFVLTTRFTELDQIELNVAQDKAHTSSNPSENLAGTIVLTLGGQGVQWGTRYYSYRQIGPVIMPYMPAAGVVIEAGPEATVQQMVNMLDIAKLAGATNITLKEKEK